MNCCVNAYSDEAKTSVVGQKFLCPLQGHQHSLYRLPLADYVSVERSSTLTLLSYLCFFFSSEDCAGDNSDECCTSSMVEHRDAVKPIVT